MSRQVMLFDLKVLVVSENGVKIEDSVFFSVLFW